MKKERQKAQEGIAEEVTAEQKSWGTERGNQVHMQGRIVSAKGVDETCKGPEQSGLHALRTARRPKWVGGLQWTSKNKADNDPEEAARAW